MLRESTPHDGYVLPRRDLPVVFCSKGKEVARLPFESDAEREQKKFLGVVRQASQVAMYKVVDPAPKPPVPGGVPPYPLERALFGGKPPATAPNSLEGRIGECAAGEKLIYALDPARGAAGGVYLKWTAAREKAVKFALAPGWLWTENSFRCPWCRGKPAKRTRDPKVCAPRGLCMTCARKVGPATRGAELKLGTHLPNVEITFASREAMEDAKANRVRITSGQTPSVSLAVDSKAKEVPEVRTPGGGKLLLRCRTVFFLVEGPGLDGPACVFHVIPPDRAAREAPRPLRKSASARLSLGTRTATARPVFTKPGSYMVRAVAGRLISNSVTVIVEAGGGKPDPAAQVKLAQVTKLVATANAQQVKAERALKLRRPREARAACSALRKISAELRALGEVERAARLAATAARLEKMAGRTIKKSPKPPPKEVF
jgi:hypothetical protein